MSFQISQAQYRRYYEEHQAWILLRADNAPYIFAFIDTLFSNHSEVTYGQARQLLDLELVQSRNEGVWDTNIPANIYLNQWIQQGYLRELNDQLTKTDAFETALRFVKSLDEPSSGTTASHLRIVQEAVRDFVVALSTDPDEKLARLEQKKAEIQAEIDAIQSGVLVELDEHSKREQMREVYHLASQLRGDFRYLEEEIRQLDRNIRTQMITEDASAGRILQQIMDQEAELLQTEAGSAFDSFFLLLCDPNRQLEFREQLRLLADSDAAQYLNSSQLQYIANLISVLSRESEQVIQMRRRTEQELRHFIESGQAAENHQVSRLISEIEKAAVDLAIDQRLLKHKMNLRLSVEPISFFSPDALRLRAPSERLVINTEEEETLQDIDLGILANLEAVNTAQIIDELYHILCEQGVRTVKELVEKRSIHLGLEELLVYIRLARAVNAVELPGQEQFTIHDRSQELLVSVPKFLLSHESFPEDFSSLVI
ncbi:DUF3375 domain-containing protein [Oligella sp. MSHR50489EDL]|uniref:DUF3375 domain-containing protein n=1 Tax=Oligella sp. MSHR50489EDL TaxID=3139409 RepID=UPI003D816FDD